MGSEGSLGPNGPEMGRCGRDRGAENQKAVTPEGETKKAVMVCLGPQSAPGLTGRPLRAAVSSAAGPEDIPSRPDALSSPVTRGSYSSQHAIHVRQCKILRLSGCKMQDSQSADKLTVAHVSLLMLTTRRRRSKSRLIKLKCLGLGILCTNLTSGFVFLSLFFLPSDFPTNLSSYIVCIFISCLNTDVEPGEKQMNW